MAEVRKLPDQLINLIAAGEVVERPASVVKELLENALDAGASSVEIELEAGGRKLIAVRDDGGGMSRHDLLMAVQRHATSKIASASDLNDIHTLGFRGEALPSIASVSRMTILTSTGEEAWKMVITGGRMDTMEPAGRTRGTTVTVENLFFNQPARRKFLRSETTELSWIERMVTGASLAALGCGFRLLHGGREVFSLPAASSVEERLRHRYGLSKGQRCVSGSSGSSGVKVDLTVFPDKRWTSRAHQYILVNGRPVTAPAVYRPIREALSGPAGEPLLACSIHLEPSLVDVNAHPAKREVRFRKPYEVESAVRSALVGITASRRESTLSSSSVSFTGGGGYRPAERPSRVSSGVFQTALDFEMPSREKTEPSAPASWEDPVEMLILSRSYIVTQTATGLLLVDQHAAHERITYERLRRMHARGDQAVQELLTPMVLDLSPREHAAFEPAADAMEQLGIVCEPFGETSIAVRSVPQPLADKDIREAVLGLLHAIIEGEVRAGTTGTRLDEMLSAIACHSSVRAGKALTRQEAQHLLDELVTEGSPLTCPHGRPLFRKIPLPEVERWLGRRV